MEILRNDAIILRTLKKAEALNKIDACSLNEIKDLVKNIMCINTLRNRIGLLYKNGYVAKGYADVKRDTFYITDKGLKLLEC